MKFGPYNGQLRDVEPVAARAMLQDGRAELPCLEREPVAELAPPVIEAKIKRGKR